MARLNSHIFYIALLWMFLLTDLAIAVSFAARSSANLLTDGESRYLFTSALALGITAIAMLFRKRWGYYGLMASHIGMIVTSSFPLDDILNIYLFWSLIAIILLTTLSRILTKIIN